MSSDCQSNLCWQQVCAAAGPGGSSFGGALVTGYGLEGTSCLSDAQCLNGVCVNYMCRPYGGAVGGTIFQPGGFTGSLLPDGVACASDAQCLTGIYCFSHFIL